MNLSGPAKEYCLSIENFFSVFISLLTGYCLILSKEPINGSLFIYIYIILSAIMLTGKLLISQSNQLRLQADLPFQFIIGFVFFSSTIIFLSFFIGLTVLQSTLVFGLSAIVILRSKKIKFTPLIKSYSNLLPLIFLSLGILPLIKLPVSSPGVLYNTGNLPIWSDYFIHGLTIASFGSEFSQNFDMEIARVDKAFYHYAPFIFPAVLQSLSHLSGLSLATSCLLPLGILIALLGTYVLAVELCGKAGGSLAVAVVICIPAHLSFVQSGWFDFYWLLFIAPGSGYALGVSALIGATLLNYFKRSDSTMLWVTLALLCSLIVIRVHFFVLLAPAVLLLIAIHRWKIRLRTLAISGLGITGLLIVCLTASPSLMNFWMQYGQPITYLDLVTQNSLIYGQPIITTGLPAEIRTIYQTMIALAAVLGIYAVLYPVVLVSTFNQWRLNLIDLLPLFLIVIFLLLMLFAPALLNGDITEFKHRHFLLVYAVIAIYTSSQLFNYLKRKMPQYAEKMGFGLSFLLMTTTIIVNHDKNLAKPDINSMPWAAEHHGTKVIPGMIKAAFYLRENSLPGDIFAVAQPKSAKHSTLANQLGAVSGIPAFISRPDIKGQRSVCIKQLVDQRVAVLQEILSSQTWQDAKMKLRENGIRWLLLLPDDQTTWSNKAQIAPMIIGDVRLLDAGSEETNTISRITCPLD